MFSTSDNKITKQKEFKLSKYLSVYQTADFLTQLKAQFFFKVSIAFSSFMVLLLLLTLYIENTYYSEFDPLVISLEILCLFLSFLAIYLIRIGKLNLPFHFMLLMSFSFIWAVIFYESDLVIPRVDSICFTYGMLALTALLAGQKRWSIILYSIGNIVFLSVFCLYTVSAGQISEGDSLEFFVDNLLAYIFIATVAYNIHVIYNKSINRSEAALAKAQKAEEDLKLLNEKLEEKVSERTKELNETLQRLEETNIEYYLLNEKVSEEARLLQITNEMLTLSEHRLVTANQTKDKFFSIIAHDLRGPLGSFRECAKMLYDKADVIDQQQLTLLLRSLKDSSSNVYSLLENLLGWSRSQQGLINVKKEEIDLHYISSSCINTLRNVAEDKQIELLNNIPSGSIIFTDTTLLTTIIRNLLSNSIKFSHEGSKIEVNLEELQNQNFFSNLAPDKSYYQLSVKDYGVGMSDEILQNLFKIEIHHTSRGTKKETGTGIGLILCKEFTDLLEGIIWAESELGKGSVFNLIIPKQ